jgi:hypothetical protein
VDFVASAMIRSIRSATVGISFIRPWKIPFRVHRFDLLLVRPTGSLSIRLLILSRRRFWTKEFATPRKNWEIGNFQGDPTGM